MKHICIRSNAEVQVDGKIYFKCKALQNKDHPTCGKERCIINPDHRAVPTTPQVRGQQLG
jgi:hypothetical protein